MRPNRARSRQNSPLLRQALKNGPRPGAQVEAASCSLLAATDALGVRSQRGQWFLPG
jgi:hypothetical protein